MDFSLTPTQRDIKQAAREFAEGEFPKVAQECDREETMDRDIMQRARELGFVGVFIDEAYGGMGLGFLETALVMEEFWRVDPGHREPGNVPVLRQRDATPLRHRRAEGALPQIGLRGGKIGAVAVTEPDAGSDVLNVSTRAVKQDGGYLVNGSKMFISNGDIADFFVTLCLTNPEAKERRPVTALS